jgi:hypothetical protein
VKPTYTCVEINLLKKMIRSIKYIVLVTSFCINPFFTKAQGDLNEPNDSLSSMSDSIDFKYQINISMAYNKGRLNQLRIPLKGYGSTGV